MQRDGAYITLISPTRGTPMWTERRGVAADFMGTVNSRPAHVVIADRRLYVP